MFLLAFAGQTVHHRVVKHVLGRVTRWVLWSLLVVVLLTGLIVGSVWWFFHPSFTRSDGIVYAQRHGQSLTFDVIRPAKPNGLGILLMVSGGWRSGPSGFKPFMAAPLLQAVTITC